MDNQNSDGKFNNGPKEEENGIDTPPQDFFARNLERSTNSFQNSQATYTPQNYPSAVQPVQQQQYIQNYNTPPLSPPKEKNASSSIFTSCLIAFLLAAFLQRPEFLLLGIIVAICLGIFASKKPKRIQIPSIQQPSYTASLPNQAASPQAMPPSSFLEGDSMKSKIYRQFHDAQEYNAPWLDVRNQTLHLQPNDQVLLGNWTKNQIAHRASFIETIQTTFMLFIYFGIYAIIAFIFLDQGHLPADHAIQALFFPMFPFLLLSYRGLDKYISAIVLSYLLINLIYVPLYNRGIMTEEGIVFLRYFVFLIDIFPGMRGFLQDISGTGNIWNFTFQVLVVLFLFEGVLLLLRFFFVSKPKVEMVITQNNLFIRDKTRLSRWEDFKLLIWIVINPFNVKSYSDMRKRLQYNKMSAQEGRYYDYAKIPLKAVRRVEKKKNSIVLGTLGSIIIMLFGFLFLPIVIVGLILLFKAVAYRNSHTITIHIDRDQCEGSWIMTHGSNIFIFDRTPEIIANYFSPMNRM